MTPLPVSRAIWWGLPALIVLLWVAGVLVVPNIPGLPQAPEFVWIALPVTRFVRDVASAIALGSLVVGGLMCGRPDSRVLRWTSAWALIWFASITVQSVLTLADIVAVDPVSILTPTAMWSFLTQVQVGQVLLAQAIGALLVGLAAWAVTGRLATWALIVIAALAVAAPGISGHGGLSAGHESATISLAIHISAVSLWVGGLIAVVAILLGDPGRATAVLPRFSTLALVCVIVVAESGLLNASLRLASPASFIATPYGALLIAKSVLLACLIALGWRQRSTVLPALRAGEPIAGTQLARVAGFELLAMGIAIAASVTLARVGPAPDPASTHLFDPLAVVLLALVVPLFLRYGIRRSRMPAWLQTYPETAAVALLVVVAVVCGVGATEALLGRNLGSIVGVLLIVLLGWVVVSSVSVERGRPVIVGLMIGWPVTIAAVTWLEAMRTSTPALAPVIISTLLAEALLALWWRSMALQPALEPVAA